MEVCLRKGAAAEKKKKKKKKPRQKGERAPGRIAPDLGQPDGLIAAGKPWPPPGARPAGGRKGGLSWRTRRGTILGPRRNKPGGGRGKQGGLGPTRPPPLACLHRVGNHSHGGAGAEKGGTRRGAWPPAPAGGFADASRQKLGNSALFHRFGVLTGRGNGACFCLRTKLGGTRRGRCQKKKRWTSPNGIRLVIRPWGAGGRSRGPWAGGGRKTPKKPG